MAQSRPIPGLLFQHKDETWQGGWFLAPFWVGRGTRPPAKPWIPLWTSPTERFLKAGGVHAERGPDEEILSLLDELFEERGRRPGRIEVSEPALKSLLSERLAGSEIEVALREKLDGAEKVLSAMAAQFGARDLPGALEVPGVTLESMRTFAEAARTFFESAPWRHLSDRDVIEIRGGAPPGFGFAVVLGMGGEVTGIGFFDDLQGFWDTLAGEADPEKNWSLTFGSIAELPPDDANLWVEQTLDVAGPNAYPAAFCVQSSNRVKRPSPRVLDFLTGLLRALAASGPTELDEGRWERTVVSIGGPRTYHLSLPFLLHPPSRTELARRRILPDRRVFERLSFLLHQKLREHPLASAGEIEALMAREVGNRPIDEIPYEPRNDRERAQEICFRAFDAWGRHKGHLVEQALSLDPDCVDALLLKAERTPDRDEKRKTYERAVSAAEKILEGDVPEEVSGNLWAYYPARSFLEALHALAHALEDGEELKGAIARYQRLLRLDQGDHQQVRYCLLGRFLAAGEFMEAQRHIKRYETPDECLWAYGRALAAFGRYGDKKIARNALYRALERNPFAAARLLGVEPPPVPDTAMDEDAEDCAQELFEAWSSTRGARSWLAERLDDFNDRE